MELHQDITPKLDLGVFVLGDDAAAEAGGEVLDDLVDLEVLAVDDLGLGTEGDLEAGRGTLGMQREGDLDLGLKGREEQGRAYRDGGVRGTGDVGSEGGVQ